MKTLLDWALFYYDLGLNIIPCRKKVPGVAWKKIQKKRYARDEVERFFHPDMLREKGWDGIACITGKRSGVLVVDADSSGGIAWCDKKLPKAAYRQNTKRGAHYFYRWRSGVKSGADIFGEKGEGGDVGDEGEGGGRIVDIKGENGIIIMAPSPGYKQIGDIGLVAREGKKFPLKKLVGACNGRGAWGKVDGGAGGSGGSSGGKISGELEASLNDITKQLVDIPPDLPEPDWRVIGAAIHYESGGAAAGLDLFDSWSRGLLHGGSTHEGYSGEEVLKKWDGYGSNGVTSPAGFGKIKFFADSYREKSRMISSFDEDEDDFDVMAGIRSATEEAGNTYEEIKWVVKNFLSAGLTLIGGRPKVGKSFLCIDLAESVSSGVPAIGGLNTVAGDVVYVSMEDGARRMNRRLNDMRIKKADNFYLLYEFRRFGEGMEQDIRMLKKRLPELSLIIFDTLGQCIPGRDKKDAYDHYNPILSTIQKLAGELNIAIVMIHHNRKISAQEMKNMQNVFDLLLGSVALQAAVDSMIIMQRIPGEIDGSFMCTSRDYGDHLYDVEFDEKLLRWQYAAEAPTASRNGTDRKIARVIDGMPGKVASSGDIIRAIGKGRANIQRRLKQGVEDGIFEVDSGKYTNIPMIDQLSPFINTSKNKK